MAPFAPYTNVPQVPNYTSASKEIDRPRPYSPGAKLFEGIADIFEMGVKGADEIQKQEVEREGAQFYIQAQQDELADLQRQRNEQIDSGVAPGRPFFTPDSGEPNYENPSGPLSYAPTEGQPTEPLPIPAQRLLSGMEKASQRTAQNKARSTEMQMSGDAKMSELLQRYPNRAAEILATAQKYGFGMGKAAAQMRADINESNARAERQISKDEQWEQKRGPWLIGDPASGRPGVDPQYFKRPLEFRRSQAYRDYLEQQINGYEGQLKMNELDQSRIATRKASKDEDQRDLALVVENDRKTDLGVRIISTLNSAGYKGSNVGELMTSIRNDPEVKNNPEKLRMVNQKLQDLTLQLKETWFQQDSVTKVGDKGTRSSILGATKLDEIYEKQLTSIKMLQKALDSKGAAEDFDIAGQFARDSAGYADRRMLELNKTYPLGDTYKWLSDKFGSQIATQIYTQGDSRIKQPIDTLARDVVSRALGQAGSGKPDPRTDKPVSMGEILHDFTDKFGLTGKDGQPLPRAAGELAERVRGQILNDKLPTEVRGNYAKFMFENTRVFDKLNNSEKAAFLRNYADPKVTDAIYKLNDPAITSQYKDFLFHASRAAVQADVSKLVETRQGGSDIRFNAAQFYQLSFNPQTNQIEAQFAPDQSILAATRGDRTTPSAGPIKNDMIVPSQMGLASYGAIQRQLGQVKETVSSLNQTLGVLQPVLTKEKLPIDATITELLKTMGVNIKIDESKVSGAKSTPQPRTTEFIDNALTQPTLSAGLEGGQVTNLQELRDLGTPQAGTSVFAPAQQQGNLSVTPTPAPTPGKRSAIDADGNVIQTSYAAPETTLANTPAQQAIANATNISYRPDPKGTLVGSSRMGNVETTVANRLAKEGLEPYKIAAVMGNVQQESSFRPGISNNKGERSYGLFQWNNERNDSATRWLKANGYARNSVEGQMEYFIHEMKHYEPAAWKALQNAKTIEQANAAMKKFERYGDDSDGARLAHAKSFMKLLEENRANP